MNPFNLVRSEPGEIQVGHADRLAQQVVGFDQRHLWLAPLRVEDGLADGRQIQSVQMVPKVHLLRVELAETAGGRVDCRFGWEHEPVRFEVFITGQQHRLQHAFVQQIKAHPFGDDDVHLNAFGQVNLLGFSVNDLLANT